MFVIAATIEDASDHNNLELLQNNGDNALKNKQAARIQESKTWLISQEQKQRTKNVLQRFSSFIQINTLV